MYAPRNEKGRAKPGLRGCYLLPREATVMGANLLPFTEAKPRVSVHANNLRVHLDPFVSIVVDTSEIGRKLNSVVNFAR